MNNDWDAADYDDHHGFVHEYGMDLLGLLDPDPDERILDLGCGTGHLTAEVAAGCESVVGLDRSKTMLEDAREAYPDLGFVRGDARGLPFTDEFDAVLSNAALHWVPPEDHDCVLRGIADALCPDGRLVAEMGGSGNVDRVVSATLAALRDRGYDAGHPWYFPSVGEYASRLEHHGFEVRYARLFDRPTMLDDGEAGLRNWLSMFCESMFTDVPKREQQTIVAEIEDRLRETCYDGETWTVDYRRLRFVAVRTA